MPLDISRPGIGIEAQALACSGCGGLFGTSRWVGSVLCELCRQKPAAHRHHHHHHHVHTIALHLTLGEGTGGAVLYERNNGLMVATVEPNSTAAHHNITRGMALVECSGHPVSSLRGLQIALRQAGAELNAALCSRLPFSQKIELIFEGAPTKNSSPKSELQSPAHSPAQEKAYFALKQAFISGSIQAEDFLRTVTNMNAAYHSEAASEVRKAQDIIIARRAVLAEEERKTAAAAISAHLRQERLTLLSFAQEESHYRKSIESDEASASSLLLRLHAQSSDALQKGPHLQRPAAPSAARFRRFPREVSKKRETVGTPSVNSRDGKGVEGSITSVIQVKEGSERAESLSAGGWWW